MSRFPRIRKESTYRVKASHDLRGVTAHPEGMAGSHVHEWVVTLIFDSEFNPKIGFIRDEVAVDTSWGGRLAELEGVQLSELMSLPATSENFALWLLYYWLPHISEKEINFELSGVRVAKAKDGGPGTHVCEVMRSRGNLEGWKSFGGEVA